MTFSGNYCKTNDKGLCVKMLNEMSLVFDGRFKLMYSRSRGASDFGSCSSGSCLNADYVKMATAIEDQLSRRDNDLESANLFCLIAESDLYATDMKPESIDLFSLPAIKPEELIPADISYIYANPSYTFRLLWMTVSWPYGSVDRDFSAFTHPLIMAYLCKMKSERYSYLHTGLGSVSMVRAFLPTQSVKSDHTIWNVTVSMCPVFRAAINRTDKDRRQKKKQKNKTHHGNRSSSLPLIKRATYSDCLINDLLTYNRSRR